MSPANRRSIREASRLSSRTPLRKRFYSAAGIAEEPDGFVVTLDGKPVRRRAGTRTPRRCGRCGSHGLGMGSAAGDDRSAVEPLTRLANSVIDGVADNVAAVADDMARYFESDLLFYRAGFPDALVARQARHWDPVLRWAADDLGAHFILTEGVMHVKQPDSAVAAVRALLPQDAWSVGALHVVTTVTDRPAGAGAASGRARRGCGLGGRPCGRGLEPRDLGRGRRGRAAARGAAEGLCRRGDGAEGASLKHWVNKTFTTLV